jgi:hypothetical protein
MGGEDAPTEREWNFANHGRPDPQAPRRQEAKVLVTNVEYSTARAGASITMLGNGEPPR